MITEDIEEFGVQNIARIIDKILTLIWFEL